MRKEFKEYPTISKKEIQDALQFCVKQIVTVLPEFTDKFQKSYSEHNFYEPIENTDWTNGFWTGEIWLAYEYVKDHPELIEALDIGTPADVLTKLKNAGEVQIHSFMDRIVNKIAVNHHDMGFLYSPSCVAGYKLTGLEEGKAAAILAADQLLTRFQEKGGFLQAWGPLDQPGAYRLIIDCLLNLPLLYWASEETGDKKYRKIAERHIHTAVANVIREDYSTWHTYFFDMETGAPDHGATSQGYRDGSAWARGQAWGVYGLAIAYRYTKRADYIDLFKKVMAYFCDHLPEDLIPFWDFEFNDGDNEAKDSCSAAIAVCGMLEMARYLPQEMSAYYMEVAGKIMKSLYSNYAVKNVTSSNGLVLHSTYAKKSPFNDCAERGVDECNIWGDYFYMEALTRMSKDWIQYW